MPCNQSSSAANILPQQTSYYYSNKPLVTTFQNIPVTLFTYTVPADGIVNIQAAVTSGNTGTVASVYTRIELLIDGVSLTPRVQSGYESESVTFAPNVAPAVVNWAGRLTQGQVISIIASINSIFATAYLSGGPFPDAEGAQFTVLLFPA